MEEGQKKKYRIGGGMFLMLLAISAVADAATLIPFVGDAVGPIYWILMGFYLWKTGHGFLNWKRIVPEGISLVAEMIPAIQELPTILVATLVLLIISRMEDRTGVSLMKPLSKGQEVRKPNKRKPPLNEGGMRKPENTNGDNVIPANFRSEEAEDIAA